MKSRKIGIKKILIATYLERHLKKMLPIIRGLESRPDVILKVLLLTAAEWKLAEEAGIPYSKFDEYTGRKRRGDFDLEWGLEPLINAIDKERPDLFLAIEVNYILRNAVRHCKRLGIKTLIVQHGTPNRYSLHAFVPFEADCFAAWGNFTKEFLVSNGVEPKKILVTGGPVFDGTISLKPDRGKIMKQLGIDRAVEKLIVFTLQGIGPGNCPSAEEIQTAIVETARAASSYGNSILLVFQVHPSHGTDDTKNIINGINAENSIVVKYPDTESLMAASDGVITFFSTTAIDALILDKPLLLINLTDDKDFYPFVPMGAAFGAYAPKEIGPAFLRLIDAPDELQEGRKRAVPYMVYKTDGKSLERVMNLINSLLRKEMV